MTLLFLFVAPSNQDINKAKPYRDIKMDFLFLFVPIVASLVREAGALITTKWRERDRASTVWHRGIRGPRASLVDVDVRLARLYRVWDAFFSFHLQTIDAVITGWAPEAEKIFARFQSDNPPLAYLQVWPTSLPSPLPPRPVPLARPALPSRVRELCEQWDTKLTRFHSYQLLHSA